MLKHRNFLKLMLIAACVFSSACGINANKADPLEPFNRKIYKFNKSFDGLYIQPVSVFYKKIVPTPLRVSSENFFKNLFEIPTAANHVLQLKPKNAINDLFRFVINSTIGIFGLFDVATPLGLPREPQDLGMTLRYWGFKKSPYLVLPILGPSSVRDGIGMFGNNYLSAPYYFTPKWRNRYYVGNMIQKRSEFIENEQIIDAASVDEYSFVKESYLQHREYLQDKLTQKLDGPPE